MKKLFFLILMCLMLMGFVGTLSAQPESQTEPRERTTVEILWDYLKVFPKELGVFSSEPTTIIGHINGHAQFGYNNWRIPTEEELSLLRANNYLGEGEYMTREKPSGRVLLVTDGEDYATVQAKEQERVKAEQERVKAEQARIKAEQDRIARLRAQGYVDLGLPSGTLWRDKNEKGNFFTYEQAMSKFGSSIPTKEQMEELRVSCTWTWNGNGYKVVGPNGESIVMPVTGYRRCDGGTYYENSYGCYWSSTSDSDEYAMSLGFDSGEIRMDNYSRCYGRSVRLVHE